MPTVHEVSPTGEMRWIDGRAQTTMVAVSRTSKNPWSRRWAQSSDRVLARPEGFSFGSRLRMSTLLVTSSRYLTSYCSKILMYKTTNILQFHRRIDLRRFTPSDDDHERTILWHSRHHRNEYRPCLDLHPYLRQTQALPDRALLAFVSPVRLGTVRCRMRWRDFWRSRLEAPRIFGGHWVSVHCMEHGSPRTQRW